eukprot:2158586-Pleurochrysis_carterae.AAC.1
MRAQRVGLHEPRTAVLNCRSLAKIRTTRPTGAKQASSHDIGKKRPSHRVCLGRVAARAVTLAPTAAALNCCVLAADLRRP